MNAASAAAPRNAPTPRLRAPRFDFDAAIPRAWFGGSALASHLVNSVNLLFPEGERFFIRAVNHYMDRIDDPVLRARVRGFAGQEGRHAHAHERFFRVMEEQGYSIEGFLRVYEKIAYEGIERHASPELRLSVTVALEHYTALLASAALSDGMLDHAHPTMRALLSWHAAEEIEHKSVAFDVLRAVAPSYALRMRGMALATMTLFGFWVAAYGMLVVDDVRHGRRVRPTREERAAFKKETPLGPLFFRGVLRYLRRDFHPWETDDAALARSYLEGAGLEAAA